MRYRMKPVTVEAVKIENRPDVGALTAFLNGLPDWARAAFLNEELAFKKNEFCVLVSDSPRSAPYGSYLVRSMSGEIHPYDRDVFEATYDPLPD